VLGETRTTLARLATGGAPRVLVESGLEAALDAAAAAVRRVGPSVDVLVVGPWRGSVETDTAIYFCCLEALQNAVKHAAATHIHIRLESEGTRLLFAVSDDGSGFDLGGAATGSGLGNLSARLLPLGGRVAVESAVGTGTTVHGELPAPQSDRQSDAPEALTGATTS
jgi:signal transduction histidine kinase